MSYKRSCESYFTAKIISEIRLNGGCIADTRRLKFDNGKTAIIKVSLDMTDGFIKEAHGLQELAQANAIRIPQVLVQGSSFLLLEEIREGKVAEPFWSIFGRSFAQLHRKTNSYFGFYEDNYIGATLQKNAAGKNYTSWSDFYWQERLLFQYYLAESKGYVTQELACAFAKLENKYLDIMAGSEEKPSLLHGDLWSGNYLIDEQGLPVLIDPAVYYGHREADLAMTTLFGGFSPEFYMSYQQEFPLKDGYAYREKLYQLYHLFNHVNLFGSGYYSQVMNVLNYYLR